VGLLPPTSDRTYVEMGAGRGYLSAMVCEGWGAPHTVLVERQAYRFKAERSIRKHSTGGGVERLRLDLADFAMHAAPSTYGRRVVVTGKHLCGGATDMALRACESCRWPGQATPDAAEAGSSQSPTIDGARASSAVFARKCAFCSESQPSRCVGPRTC